MSESKPMSPRAQAQLKQQQFNIRRAQQVEEFFSHLPEAQQPRKWTLAAEHFSQDPEWMAGRDGRAYQPQTVAHLCRLGQTWAKRFASPQKATKERRKIYFLALSYLEQGMTHQQAADELNRHGYHWKAQGHEPRPFTCKNLSDFIRHHRDYWHQRPRQVPSNQTELSMPLYIRDNRDNSADDLPQDPVDDVEGDEPSQVTTPSAPPPPCSKKLPAKLSTPAVALAHKSDRKLSCKNEWDDTQIETEVKTLNGTMSVVVTYLGPSAGGAAQAVLNLVRSLSSLQPV